VLRLSTTMMDFLVARLSGEPNDHFQASVELAAVDVVRRYTRWKHKACVKAMPNQRRVNQVFKHTRVLYGSSMAPGSEMGAEASKKRKQDTGAGSQSMRAKVLGCQSMSVKVATAKTTHT
jgi:hypothetical protein